MSNNDNTGNGPNLVSLPPRPNEFAAASENVKRNLDLLIDHQTALAKLRRASFLAHVAAGFTEVQALELCCK